MCWAYVEVSELFFIALICSLNAIIQLYYIPNNVNTGQCGGKNMTGGKQANVQMHLMMVV
jgi:hypothetical protein